MTDTADFSILQSKLEAEFLIPLTMSQIPLSELLAETAKVIHQVMLGQSLSRLLPAVDDRYRAGVQALSFFALRHWNRGLALSDQLLSKKAPNPLFKSLLALSLTLLSAEDFAALEQEDAKAIDHPVYDAFTLVNQAVKAAILNKKTAPFKALLNACLRRYQRESADLLKQVLQQEEVRYNFPTWWIKALRKAYPEQYPALLKAANQAATLCLRVNRRQVSMAQFKAALAEADIHAKQVDEDALGLEQAVPVRQIPGFAEGHFSVQDLAAQQAIKMMPLADGLRVLDACAAPGGKTSHMLEHYDLDMSILDVDERRLKQVHENLARLKLRKADYADNPHYQIRSLVADAADIDAWYDGRPFDVIMADVPCTAAGIVRRHPDIKWLRRPEDVKKTSALQRSIVEALWTTLKPGGHLLYITCSIFPEEGELQAAYLAKHLPGVERLPALGQLLALPDENGIVKHDGFFYALFKKFDE
ncbi:Ribosomal RNA small subunit methyltransferase B [Oligella sp. MSHR50489EDL]